MTGSVSWAAAPIEKKIVAADGAAGDEFGYSVAADGDTMVAGAAFDVVGTNANQGSAYVFERHAGGSNAWGQVARLTAPEGQQEDRFGESVAMCGDVIVVGTSRYNYMQGAAFVFERNAGGANAWGLVAHLRSPDGASFDYFGWAVGVHSNMIVVGALAHNAGAGQCQGAAYMFCKGVISPSWDWVLKMTAPEGAADDYFGSAVAVGEGNRIVVGACGDDGACGAAYLFSIEGVQKLTASDRQANDLFGVSASAARDVIVVGAQATGEGGVENQGSAYVFQYQRSTLDWREKKKLQGGDTIGGAYFGCAAAAEGDVVVVGARGGNAGTATDRGAAYVFQRDAGGVDAWGQVRKLAASDGVAGNCFGRYVAIANGDIIAGAHGDAADRGAAYLYEGVTLRPAVIVMGTNGAAITTGEPPDTAKGTDFGIVAEGVASTHTLSITNAGDYTLHIGAWSITGDTFGAFRVSGMPSTVMAGTVSNFAVVFFSVLPRTSTGTLAISNDAMAGPYIVNLAGTAAVGPRTARGTPHWWLGQFGWTDYEAADVLDPDGDGMPTWKEWIANTDPTRSASVLRILSMSASPPRQLVLLSSVDRLYSLLFTADLVGGAWSGVVGQTDVPGNGSFLSLTDTNETPVRFYRIAVRLP